MIEELNAEERILAAARKIFIKKGYDGARMQEIADEAGINKAMLHYYFRNKDLLYERIFVEFTGKLFPNINAVVSDDNLDIFEKVEKFVENYIYFLTQNPDIPVFIVGEMSKRPEVLQKIFSEKEAKNEAPMIAKFAMELMQESAKGKIKTMNPFHFMISAVSMCAFPFAAKPMMKTFMKMSEEDFNLFLQERKKEITTMLHHTMRP
jgi:TetR/AcrR family transcriptional regulator